MDGNKGSLEEARSHQLYSSRAQIAILDFGSQYSHLIARKVRELHVFCELYSCLVTVANLEANNVVGIILSGGPSSVYEESSPHVHASVWQYIRARNIPVLGICYGMQEMAHMNGGVVSPSKEREFGRAQLSITKDPEYSELANLLFSGVEHSQMWMSHGDKVSAMPAGFVKIAFTSNSEHAAIANPATRMFGIQFHPEVTHSIQGKKVLENFVVGVCAAPTDWNMRDIAADFIKEVSHHKICLR
jgi:GMP synthase (glutamine-hydrolysing)